MALGGAEFPCALKGAERKASRYRFLAPLQEGVFLTSPARHPSLKHAVQPWDLYSGLGVQSSALTRSTDICSPPSWRATCLTQSSQLPRRWAWLLAWAAVHVHAGLSPPSGLSQGSQVTGPQNQPLWYLPHLTASQLLTALAFSRPSLCEFLGGRAGVFGSTACGLP